MNQKKSYLVGFFFFSTNICNFFFFSGNLQETLVSWGRAGHSAALGAGPQSQAQMGDRGGCRDSFKLFPWFIAGRWARDCYSAAGCVLPGAKMPLRNNARVRAILTSQTYPPADRIASHFRKDISSVHQNYWEGPQFPHNVTLLWWQWGCSQKGTIISLSWSRSTLWLS